MSLGTRLGAVRVILADSGIDALLVTNPANRRYLTGFTADDHAADETSGYLLVTRSDATLFVSPTNMPWAYAEIDQEHIELTPWRRDNLAPIADRLAAIRATKVAVEDATTSAEMWFKLRDTLEATVELVRAGDTVDLLRANKDPQELDALREAARLTDAAFELAASRLTVGMSERQGADIVRDALREVGSEGEAFDTIVASGPNAAKPHHAPGERPLAPGEPIIIDMGARVSGYNGDLTRTICLGEADARLVNIYSAVLEAQRAGLESIRAGVPGSAPDLATREVFAGHGFAEHIIHGAGHGLGLRVHEAPSVHPTSETPLEAGHVITMEPGLYIAGWGGVRIEDVAIVRDGGHENITSTPKGVDVFQR